MLICFMQLPMLAGASGGGGAVLLLLLIFPSRRRCCRYYSGILRPASKYSPAAHFSFCLVLHSGCSSSLFCRTELMICCCCCLTRWYRFCYAPRWPPRPATATAAAPPAYASQGHQGPWGLRPAGCCCPPARRGGRGSSSRVPANKKRLSTAARPPAGGRCSRIACPPAVFCACLTRLLRLGLSGLGAAR